MTNEDAAHPPPPSAPPCTKVSPQHPLTIHIREDLARAFRRCTWMIIHETGRTQSDIMEEMVRDFLVKHGC